MEEKNLLVHPPEKVLFMYRAVADMVSEGVDVKSMKVSDITLRAGIGKGTAYEYFSSKEEIITMALMYDVVKKREAFSEIVCGEETFPEKMGFIFDYVGDHFCENETFPFMFRLLTNSYEMPDFLKREYEKLQQEFSCSEMEELIDRLLEQGAHEGIIEEKNIFFRRMAFAGQLITFASVCMSIAPGKEVSVTVEQAKKFAYESLVRSLAQKV